MTLEDQYRVMISGYYGVKEMDEYDLKLYALKDIENYIHDFMEQNPSKNFDYDFEKDKIEQEVPLKTKLQNALELMNKMELPIDLRLLITRRLNNVI